MRTFLVALLLLCAFSGVAQTYTVETVPNVKLVNNSYVSDPDHILKDETVAAINAELTGLEDSTTAQIAVVMLKSIGDEDNVDFAQRLFDAWGIGKEATDNGLLILYIEDQRTIRFHTGDGMEAALPDARCKQIQRDYMVPRFKEGDVDAGMLDGIREAASIIRDPSNADDITAADEDTELDYNGFAILFSATYGIIFLITFLVKSTSNGFRDSK